MVWRRSVGIPAPPKCFLVFFDGKAQSQGSFESQIAAICDDIAYNNNDLDDGLHAGLFEIDELEDLQIIKDVLKKIKFAESKPPKRFKYELIRKLINLMVDDLIMNTKENLKKLKIKNSIDILESQEALVLLSGEMQEKEKKLKQFLRKNMYNHPKVKTMNFKAKKIISDLFDLFSDEPYLLPMHWKTLDEKHNKLMTTQNSWMHKMQLLQHEMTVKFSWKIHWEFGGNSAEYSA